VRTPPDIRQKSLSQTVCPLSEPNCSSSSQLERANRPYACLLPKKGESLCLVRPVRSSHAGDSHWLVRIYLGAIEKLPSALNAISPVASQGCRSLVENGRQTKGPQQGWKPHSWEIDYKPRSRVSIVLFNPRAITCKVIIPTSRLPNSMSDMCPLFMSRFTAISVCVQPFFLRCARTRFPSCTKRA
jgi:hypothetical protein